MVPKIPFIPIKNNHERDATRILSAKPKPSLWGERQATTKCLKKETYRDARLLPEVHTRFPKPDAFRNMSVLFNFQTWKHIVLKILLKVFYAL